MEGALIDDDDVFDIQSLGRPIQHRRFLIEFESRVTVPSGSGPGRWWADCISYSSENSAFDDVQRRINGTKWTTFRNISLKDTVTGEVIFSTGSIR